MGDGGTLEAEQGDPTIRNTKVQIENALQSQPPWSSIANSIELALRAESWLSFNGLPPFANNIIGAHNSGHEICGDTIAVPNTASFDPLFWFFHCNWDRLWWQWQRNAKVQRLADFQDLMAHTGEDARWLDDPVIGLVVPFGFLAEETIDSVEMGVDYELPPGPESHDMFEVWTAERSGQKSISIARTPKVMVRLEGFERLGIPGSVLIELLAAEQVVASHYIFQSTVPENCPTCREKGRVNIDFEVPLSSVEEVKLGVKVTCVGTKGKRENVPLEDCGNPTLSVRLPLATAAQ